MISEWERILNVPPDVIAEDKKMNLESILKTINVDRNKNRFVLNDDYKTIRYITEQEYKDEVYEYIEPQFIESISTNSLHPRFILFSAPGATGKTALAKHICYSKNGIFWDLPDNKVAEYSFEGARTKSVGFRNVSNFVESLIKGENFYVIDAFDEAEAGSGRTGIEFFLRDLNDVTKEANGICAILLARTESAIFIKNYFLKEEISFAHYQVGYFTEYNAKNYVKTRLVAFNINITPIVTTCIDQQFKEVRRILMDTGTEDSFLGYAPVLNALAASYTEGRNTLRLLKDTETSANSFTLLKKILDDLLIREQDKFDKAMKVKLPQIEDYSESVYGLNEQLLRIFGLIWANDSNFLVDVDNSIPIEFYEEYLEVVNTQLPQNPFVLAKDINGETGYDFTGIAFRDFVIAYGLSLEDVSDFVEDYIIGDIKYYPSQMLVEFYNLFSDGKIKGKHIPFLYNSFMAHTKLGDKVNVHINGDMSECSVEFELEREQKIVSNLEFNLKNPSDGIYISQLANCYIDFAGKVFVGDLSHEARISNSTIICDEIIWCGEQISIEAYSPGECVFKTEVVSSISGLVPRFEIKTDNRNNLKIQCPALNGYYKLLAHANSDVFEEAADNFVTFSNLLRRIFSCLRSHSKDTPARKRDYIDNRIISMNPNKKRILNFLLEMGILYTDNETWLYKLNTAKLSEFSIIWNEIREGDFNSLRNLYILFTSE